MSKQDAMFPASSEIYRLFLTLRRRDARIFALRWPPCVGGQKAVSVAERRGAGAQHAQLREGRLQPE